MSLIDFGYFNSMYNIPPSTPRESLRSRIKKQTEAIDETSTALSHLHNEYSSTKSHLEALCRTLDSETARHDGLYQRYTEILHAGYASLAEIAAIEAQLQEIGNGISMYRAEAGDVDERLGVVMREEGECREVLAQLQTGLQQLQTELQALGDETQKKDGVTKGAFVEEALKVVSKVGEYYDA